MRHEHFTAAASMVAQFAFVAPVANLSHAGPVLSAALGWQVKQIPHSNSKTARGQALAKRLQQQLGPSLAEHNRWDLKLYERVKERFEADAAMIRTPPGEQGVYKGM